MTDEHSTNQTQTSHKKPFFKSLFTRFFQDELKNLDELVEIIRNSEQNDVIDQDTREMIEGVMEIAELRVHDIMVPRNKIVFIEENQDFESCLESIIQSSHSRFPVITEEHDEVKGILRARDLLKFLHQPETFQMENLLHPAIIVPESKPVDRMLKEFRSEDFNLAIVVDEFGNISGLITIEDILEQIVGEIEDNLN